MTAISAAKVKELRDATGAGMMDCKQALTEANGDFEKAIEILRKKGLAALKKRAGRKAREGLVESYVHAGGRLGVLAEINCETDFVARSEDFKEFAHDMAMQIAASNPLYVSREDIPPEVVEKEMEILRLQTLNEGKPEKVVEKIIEGRLEKFFEEVCLLEQPFVKDLNLKVQDVLSSLAGKIGENTVIRRFCRYQLGELEE
jgi:elongation factor Ts